MSVQHPEAKKKAYRCPCCNYKTLHGRGQDEICEICLWHDDGQDEAEVDEVWGGPNKRLSLRQARLNFLSFGAKEERVRGHVRAPRPEEQ